MRFNMNKCKSGKACRFGHQCSIPKANGERCGGFHTAAKPDQPPIQSLHKRCKIAVVLVVQLVLRHSHSDTRKDLLLPSNH